MMSLCHCHSVGIAMATGWARAPTQPHIHPAPYTHLQELSVAVVTEAARASGRREGLNVCVRETSSSLVGTTMSRCLTSTSTACIHLRFMRKRERNIAERGRVDLHSPTPVVVFHTLLMTKKLNTRALLLKNLYIFEISVIWRHLVPRLYFHFYVSKKWRKTFD